MTQSILEQLDMVISRLCKLRDKFPVEDENNHELNHIINRLESIIYKWENSKPVTCIHCDDIDDEHLHELKKKYKQLHPTIAAKQGKHLHLGECPQITITQEEEEGKEE